MSAFTHTTNSCTDFHTLIRLCCVEVNNEILFAFYIVAGSVMHQVTQYKPHLHDLLPPLLVASNYLVKNLSHVAS